MTYRHRPSMIPACLGGALLLLAACSPGSPEAGRPNTAPPSSNLTATSPSGGASTAPTSESTPLVPPTRPGNATGLSLAAAEAFVSYYVSLQNYAYATGDAQYLLDASDQGCLGCKGISDFVKFSNGKNGGLSGDYLDHLVAVKEVARAGAGRVAGTADIRTGAYQERPSPSASPVPRSAGSALLNFTLSPSQNNWVMFEMEINE